MMRFKLLSLSCVLALISSCASNAPINPYAEIFEAESIRSILVIPAVNKALDIDAPKVLLTTLPQYLGELGYYVFPVNTVKVVLEHEGLYEAAEVHTLPPEKLANMFEADAVLYITVEDWSTKYVVLTSSTKITLSYKLVSRSGIEIWNANKTVIKDSNQNNNNGGALVGLIANAISAAVQRAAPEYRPYALQANQEVFVTGHQHWPDGPYRLVEANKKEN